MNNLDIAVNEVVTSLVVLDNEDNILIKKLLNAKNPIAVEALMMNVDFAELLGNHFMALLRNAIVTPNEALTLSNRVFKLSLASIEPKHLLEEGTVNNRVARLQLSLTKRFTLTDSRKKMMDELDQKLMTLKLGMLNA